VQKNYEHRISQIEQAVFGKNGIVDRLKEVCDITNKLEGRYNFAIGGLCMLNALITFSLLVWQILKK